MMIRTIFIGLIFLTAGCAVSQAPVNREGPGNGTGDIVGMVYDETSLLVHPPFHLVLFNQNRRFVKLVNEFSFSFDSIPTGSYTLAVIDSVKTEGFVNADTLYDVSIETDSISMLAMFFNAKDDQWQPVKFHRRDKNITGNIEGWFNVEEYEDVTGCWFKPENGKYASITVKNKFMSFQTYTDSLGFFEIKNVPPGFYQANAGKRISKDECLPTKARNYSKYPSHGAIGIFAILILPNQTSAIYFNKIYPSDHMTSFPGIMEQPGMDAVKWRPQFKN